MTSTVALPWCEPTLPSLSSKAPYGCDTLFIAATLWTRADRGYGDIDSQSHQAVSLCKLVMGLDCSLAGAIGLLGRC